MVCMPYNVICQSQRIVFLLMTASSQTTYLYLISLLQNSDIRWKFISTVHLCQGPAVLQWKVLQLLLDMLRNKINCNRIFQSSWYNLDKHLLIHVHGSHPFIK